MFSCLHVWLSRELKVFAQLRIWPRQVWACHCDKITQTSYKASARFVEIGFGGRVTVMFWQPCVWFHGCDRWKVISESKSTQKFFGVMSLRKLCSTCDQVTGNIASKVVFKFEWTCIGAIKCLEQTFAKSVEDLLICTCSGYENVVNVCAKEDAMVINCDFPHTLPSRSFRHVEGKRSW